MHTGITNSSAANHNHRLSRWFESPYKGAITGGTNVPEGLPTAPLLRATAKAVLLLSVLYWLTRKQVNMLVYADLVICYILLQLLLDILLNLLCVLSYCVNIISSTPKNAGFHTYISNVHVG